MSEQPSRVIRFTAPLLLFLFLFALATQSQASVLLYQYRQQTQPGENFTFSFSGLTAPISGTGGLLTIRARGDYDQSNVDEFLTWDFDGLGIGFDVGPALGGTTILGVFGTIGNDVEWQQSFTISSMDLFTAMIDSTIDISIDLSGSLFESGVACCNPNLGTPFFEVAFEYAPVPEPTAALLFVIGFSAVGWRCKARTASGRST